MKVISICAAGVTLVLIALSLVPWTGEYRVYCAVGGLICTIVVLMTIVSSWRERPSVASVDATIAATSTSRNVASPPPVQAAPVSTPAHSAEAEVIAFLATFQEKGRLVDFLQDDITAYSDAQVGAAARVVHQGCKAVLNEYFRIVPVRSESEGANVTVPAEYVTGEYRLVGKISGQAPFSGTLMHRGWKAESVHLPRLLRPDHDRLPTIAPAEVELR